MTGKTLKFVQTGFGDIVYVLYLNMAARRVLMANVILFVILVILSLVRLASSRPIIVQIMA